MSTTSASTARGPEAPGARGMASADDIVQGLARADLARFLSACFYEPDAAFAEERLFESMAEAAGRVDADLAAQAKRLGEAFAAEGVDALLVEYTRLFLGPVSPHAAPYGSAWLQPGGSLMQESTEAVQALYQEGGFDVDDDVHELPDHVAVELEFLYALEFALERSRRENDAAERGRIEDLRRRFLGVHLGAWIEPFAARVESGSQSVFYRELAALARRFVEMELRAATH